MTLLYLSQPFPFTTSQLEGLESDSRTLRISNGAERLAAIRGRSVLAGMGGLLLFLGVGALSGYGHVLAATAFLAVGATLLVYGLYGHGSEVPKRRVESILVTPTGIEVVADGGVRVVAASDIRIDVSRANFSNSGFLPSSHLRSCPCWCVRIVANDLDHVLACLREASEATAYADRLCGVLRRCPRSSSPKVWCIGDERTWWTGLFYRSVSGR